MTLREEISTPEGKGRYVRRLFGTIADRYDFITSALSYGQDRRWKRRLIEFASLRPDDEVLDLACGTGDLMFAAASRARRVVGLDLTLRMLELAKLRALRLRALRSSPSQPPTTNYQLVQSDMLSLPFPGARFDVVTTGYGLRNVPDLGRALEEIHRVLRGGGRVLSLDFNRPEQPLVRAVYLFYLSAIGSLFGWVLHGDADTYRYIPASIRTYPGAAAVAAMMERCGFVEVRVVPVLAGLMAIHIARKPVDGRT